MTRLFLPYLSRALITIYQRTISFDHGLMAHLSLLPRCKFYPTCSEYAKKSLQKYGILQGTPLIIGRLLRCHPWSKGGIDEP